MHKKIFSFVLFSGLLISASSFAQTLPVPKELELPTIDSNGNASMPPLPGSGSIPSLPSPDSAKTDVPMPPVPAATVDTLPPPATTETAAPVSPPEMKPSDIVPAKATGKRHKRRATSKTASKLITFPKYKLPATIYKDEYDVANGHLPQAWYESDFDQLVFVAVASDDVNMLRSLIDYKKRSINMQDAGGNTPLMAAAHENALNCARFLLGRHANTEATNNQGMTASQIAWQQGNQHLGNLIEMRQHGGSLASSVAPAAEYSNASYSAARNDNPRSPIDLTFTK